MSKKKHILLNSCFFFLSVSLPAAQPITSKLDESWWAYKDVVQGSFVPGNGPSPIIQLTHNMVSLPTPRGVFFVVVVFFIL